MFHIAIYNMESRHAALRQFHVVDRQQHATQKLYIRRHASVKYHQVTFNPSSFYD